MEEKASNEKETMAPNEMEKNDREKHEAPHEMEKKAPTEMEEKQKGPSEMEKNAIHAAKKLLKRAKTFRKKPTAEEQRKTLDAIACIRAHRENVSRRWSMPRKREHTQQETVGSV